MQFKSRRWIAVYYLANAMILPVRLEAQDPAPPADSAKNVAAPEMTTHENPTTFTSGTTLVTVPVVVRDKDGKPVGNLTKENFKLADKGKAQTITKFSVERQDTRPGTPNPPETPEGGTVVLPERFVAYIFDDLHLEGGDLLQMRKAVLAHFVEDFKQGGRGAVYTTSGRNNQDFTDDLASLKAAVERVQPSSTNQSQSFECPSVSYYMADMMVTNGDSGALDAAAQEAMVCANLQSVGGAVTPLAQQMAQNSAARSLAQGDRDTQLTLGVLQNIARRMSSLPGQRMMVLMSPGFYISSNYRSIETELLNHAIRANVVISCINAQGLYTVMPNGDISQRYYAVSAEKKDQYARENQILSDSTLAELAEGTGGSLFHNNNDLRAGMRKVASVPEVRYILGFSPQDLKNDGSYHALKVSLVEGKGLTVQARHGYYAPKKGADAADEAKEQIREAVFSRDEIHDFPVDMQTQFFKTSDTDARLSVVARVDLKAIHFRKADGRNKNSLTVVAGLFDRNGNWISGTEKILDMKFKDETFQARVASGVAVRSNFAVTSGSYVVRVVVRDEEGRMMAARNGSVLIP